MTSSTSSGLVNVADRFADLPTAAGNFAQAYAREVRIESSKPWDFVLGCQAKANLLATWKELRSTNQDDPELQKWVKKLQPSWPVGRTLVAVVRRGE
ncbi:hypothetical protein HYFRA_00009013 [Hymenoscyphus fraxineus]|uniref:Uncharacterized protein n=1 Tax=Hymenoscyphus fraxineus TaxID=746836 RepID=A0A9N9KRV9_9HELO|nr:hypothetical protein HYFRA_00009013 [Hymenoscyphus fraxineus]